MDLPVLQEIRVLLKKESQYVLPSLNELISAKSG
jgi:hypothetical protein